MKYTAHTLAKIKEIPILDVWLALGQAEPNRNKKTNCIWHPDPNPSLQIGGSYNTVHCFGSCGKTFGVIKLVEEIKNIGFLEACDWLTEKFHIIKEPTIKNGLGYRPYQLDDLRDGWFVHHRKLMENKEVLDFMLRNYGITAATCDRAMLGLFFYTEEQGIIYPAPSYADMQCVKFKSVARDRKGKRMSHILAGNHETAFGMGMIQEGDRVIWTGGEEKYLICLQEGIPAFSPLIGEGKASFYAIHSQYLIKTKPKEVILACDADAAGRESNERWADLLRVGGFEGKIRLIDWEKGCSVGYDLNNAHLDGKLNAYIDNAIALPVKKEADVGIWSGSRGSLNQWAATDTFMRAHTTLINANQEWWSFDGTCYEEMREEEVKREIAEMLAPKSRIDDINDLYNLLKPRLFQRREIWDADKNKIVCLNGVIDLEKVDPERPKINLLPHSPLYKCRNKINIEFNPTATCGFFNDRLSEIQPDFGIQALIQMIYGYCLIHDTSLQVSFIFLGRGSNGKGFITHTLTNLVGQRNVSHLRLVDIGRQFAVERMEGKLINIAPESSWEESHAEEMIKLCTHADNPVFADRKFKTQIEFFPTARLIFCINSAVRTRDTSDGLWRALVFIPFKEHFYDPSSEKVPTGGKIRDQTYYARVLDDLPGIFNWALEGYFELKRRGREGFFIPDACKHLKNMMRRDSNTVAQFAEECCIVEKDAKKEVSVRRSEIYKEYATFCKERGNPPKSHANFFSELTGIFPHIKIHKDGEGIWQADGVKLATGVDGFIKEISEAKIQGNDLPW